MRCDDELGKLLSHRAPFQSHVHVETGGCGDLEGQSFPLVAAVS